MSIRIDTKNVEGIIKDIRKHLRSPLAYPKKKLTRGINFISDEVLSRQTNFQQNIIIECKKNSKINMVYIFRRDEVAKQKFSLV